MISLIETCRDEIIDEIDNQFDLIEAALAQLAQDTEDQLTSMTEDKTNYILARQAEIIGSLGQAVSQSFQGLSETTTSVAAFDPTRYVLERQDELNRLVQRFRENNTEWSVRVHESISDRTEQVFQILMQYDEFVWQLQGDMRDAVADSERRIGEAQGQLLYDMTDSHNLNNRLIGDFETVLPNSRIGAQANTDFFSFVVTPIRTEETGAGTQAAFIQMQRREDVPITRHLPFIIAGLTALLILISAIRYGIEWARDRQDSE